MNSDKTLYNADDFFQISVRDVVYCEYTDSEIKARIYQPLGPGPFPCILDVHGGIWNGGSLHDDSLMDQSLAESGIVVVAIDYRLAPDHTYPAQIQDVNYAVKWIKSHADKLRISNSLIGALGASSGAHTVVLNAMRPDDPRYSSLDVEDTAAYDASLSFVIAMWPVLDPYARYLYATENQLDHIKSSTERYFLTEDTMREGNPQSILDKGEQVLLPPILIIQGTDDRNVPISIPQKFLHSYRKSGGHAELELFPNMPHGFANHAGSESDRAMALAKTFVQTQVNRRYDTSQ